MTIMKHLMLAGAAAGLMWSTAVSAAEDGKVAPKAEGDNPAPKAEGDRGGRPERERGGRPDMRQRGDGERGGAEGRGAWMNGINAAGLNIGGRADRGGNNVMSTVSRMLGIEIEDPKAPVKLEEFPLGAERRAVLNVPIGGVDNPGGSGSGWKMESVFKLTEEQQKALDGVRGEYEAEQKKLDAEIKEELKKVAEKVKTLRAKYELRANDVLAGDDKSSKEKMDALAKELHTKNNATITEVQPLFDLNDMQQGFSMIRMVREKSSVHLKDYETKLLELIPMASRETIAEVIRRQSEMRDQMNRWMGGVGVRGQPGAAPAGGERQERGDRPERRARGEQEPVKPPRPPEADKKGEF